MHRSAVKTGLVALLLFSVGAAAAADLQTLPRFPLPNAPQELHRLAQPATPFNRIGRKFSLLGFESGTFEAWAFPLKLLSNFEFSFLLQESSRPIPGREIVRYVDANPGYTTLTYTFQSFVVTAHYITLWDEPAAMILLEVESTTPLTILCAFRPVLQPMWPAGLGGQYAYWNDELKAYLISEPTRHNHALAGSPAAAGISYTPAHMLSDTPSEFKIEIGDPQQAAGRYIPLYIAGGKGERDSVKALYQRLGREPQALAERTFAHYQGLLEEGLRVQTPAADLNLAYDWAKIALDGLLVENPDLGCGLVAGWGASGASGRPGFGWFFGGDAFINSLGITGMGWHQTVRTALEYARKWQRADGKMAHELSQAAGYIDWFKAYPYAYIHGDTSPLYIVACHDYVRASGDLDFLHAAWPSLRKAYLWSLGTDANGDGLMDNPKAGLGSVEYGALTNLATDIYTGALSVHMSFAMADLAAWMQDRRLRRVSEAHLELARASFDARFWDDSAHSYSNAFNEKGERLPDPSPWISTAALFAAGRPDHIQASIERLGWSDLSTDWGVRSISSASSYYQPLSYNYGGVWPFLTGFVATAQYLCQRNQQAYGHLLANSRHTFVNALGGINELFSGQNYLWPQEAVSQQGFSSLGVVLPLVRGLLGLEGDALRREILLTPRFPAVWEEASWQGYRVGPSRWSLSYRRLAGCIRATLTAEQGTDYAVTFAPALGPAAVIDSVRLDGKAIAWTVNKFPQAVQPEIKFLMTAAPATVELYFHPGLEVTLPTPALQVGAGDAGLKLISMETQERTILLRLQGRPGCRYRLDTTGSGPITAVHGAAREGGHLVVAFPPAGKEAYIPLECVVELAPLQP